MGLAPGRRTVTAGVDGAAVFSVDDRSVQLHWRGSQPGTLVAEAVACDDRPGRPAARAEVAASPPGHAHRRGTSRRLSALAAGPGTVVLDGLAPATGYDLWLRTTDGRARVATIRTLPTPPGPLLSAFATVTDTHVGERRFGVTARVSDPGYPTRALAGALADAAAWGATTVVAKGDLTNESVPAEFRHAAALLTGSGMATVAVLGNHDQRPARPHAWRHAADAGLDVEPGTRVVDLPGLRLICTTSVGDHTAHMRTDDLDAVADAAAGAPGPCAVVVHHPPCGRRLHHPVGIDPKSTRALLGRLRAANPRSLVLAGHTHRHRVRWVRGVVCVETGSTKDFPAAVTGYRVHEGGVVQVTRRITDPRVVAFADATSAVLAGQWGRWSPGTLGDRSFSLAWG